MSKPKGLEVDRRVGIALSVLSPKQREAVEHVLRTLEAFALAAARLGRAHPLRTSGQPLYLLRVTPTLRLVYTLVGDTVHVVDLVERGTLDHFADAATGRRAGRPVKRRVARKSTNAGPK